jgi:hypothetical protein
LTRTLREKVCESNKNNRDLRKEITVLSQRLGHIKANCNEQYNRKNNIKIYGVKELKGEKIVDVKTTLKEKGV